MLFFTKMRGYRENGVAEVAPNIAEVLGSRYNLIVSLVAIVVLHMFSVQVELFLLLEFRN